MSKHLSDRRSLIFKIILALTIFIILLPIAVILIWAVTARWSWPHLLPESYTTRTITELFFGSSGLVEILVSSIVLATIVAIVSTVIALMAARATEIYGALGTRQISFWALLPLLVPGTAFAMGIQVTLIRMGLNDSLVGVAIVHVIAALPYCVLIMLDMTHAVGIKLEEQAAVLGANPTRGFIDASLPQLLPGILASASMAYIVSYSQYFTTLLAGGGRVRTLAIVLVPYIQSGDRALSAIYATVFIASALGVFFIFELFLKKLTKGGDR